MPNINTLSSLKRGNEDEGASDDESRQGFYVGGSDHSGQQVLGPQSGGQRSGSLSDQVFDAARRAGAETLNAEESARVYDRNQAQSSGISGGQSVSGRRVDQAEPVSVTITFWEQGFSVEDGPLRQESDPASREFIEQIKNNQIPLELLLKHRGRAIDINLVRRNEPYKAPPMKPFSSSGRRLGGP